MPSFTLRDRRHPDKVMHPSTEAALLAMHALETQHYRFRRVLDMGAGSGVLSLAAAELWPECRILAADISPLAVEDAVHNVQAAGLESRIEVIRSDGFTQPAIRAHAPYDLVISNLLAELHIRFLASLKDCLAPRGCAILSGILAWQLPQVAEACIALRLDIASEITHGEWRALIVRLS